MSLHVGAFERAMIDAEYRGHTPSVEPTNVDRARLQLQIAVETSDPAAKLAAATTAQALIELERIEYSIAQAAKLKVIRDDPFGDIPE